MDSLYTTLVQNFPGQASRTCPDGTVQACIEKTTARKFWLVEVSSCCKPDKTCTEICTLKPLGDYAVFVENSYSKEVLHLAVDACLVCDDQGKRCDAILISDRGWYFVEFKLNIKMKNVSDNIKEAIEQVKVTISYFTNDELLKPLFQNVHVNVQLVLPTYPRSLTIKQNAQKRYETFLENERLNGGVGFARTIQL